MIDTALTLIKMILSKLKEIRQCKQDSISVHYRMGWLKVGRPDEAVDHPALFLTIESPEAFVIEQVEFSGYELAEIRRAEGEAVGGMGAMFPSILEPKESDWSVFLRVHVRPCHYLANRPTEVRYLARPIPGPEVPPKVTLTLKTSTYPHPFTVTSVTRS